MGAAFVGSLWRKWKCLENSASECFRRTLLEPTEWFQLWRLNCRLASMVALATKSKDFDMEDKWLFIKTCMEKNIPVTPMRPWRQDGNSSATAGTSQWARAGS